MKKTLFSAVFALILGVSAFGQISKGSMMIGGSAGFEHSDGTSVISLSPTIGYFVIDRLAIGGNLGIGIFTNDGDGITTISVGPLARYYFTDGSPAKFFGQGAFNFGTTRFDGESSGYNSGGLGIGASIFLNKNVAIDAILGFQSGKNEGQSDRSNSFGLSFGVQAFLSKGDD